MLYIKFDKVAKNKSGCLKSSFVGQFERSRELKVSDL
ncbi:hypothetical protein AEQU2_01331 [Aequorivita lipolytica]|nr:hypothetical protein AEQU2_01331 [Aequorivita lipolytica]